MPGRGPTFRPGDTVTHRRRGEGTVHTVHLNPITKAAAKVTVHFRRGPDVQPVVCWPDDLTVVRPLPPPGARPVLWVVPSSAPMGAA